MSAPQSVFSIESNNFKTSHAVDFLTRYDIEDKFVIIVREPGRSDITETLKMHITEEGKLVLNDKTYSHKDYQLLTRD